MNQLQLALLMDMCWRLNDQLHITPDSSVEFTGSQNLIEDFRSLLHAMDPDFLGAKHPHFHKDAVALARKYGIEEANRMWRTAIVQTSLTPEDWKPVAKWVGQKLGDPVVIPMKSDPPSQAG